MSPPSTTRRRRRRSDLRVPVPASPTHRPVLFVDDEPMAARAFQRLFDGRYHVTTASGPYAAIDLARAKRFSVVVTDLRMPGMDGLTLIEQLRAIQPGLVFIIVTGMPDLDLRRSNDTDASILATLAKPWEEGELDDMLVRAFDLHDRRADPRSSSPPGGLTALVVEEDPADAYLIRRYLERECDAAVEVAGRISEAEIMVARRQPDVILADLTLPDARGVDTIRRIRRAAPRSAIVVMSGMGDETIARQALRLGAQEVVVKGNFEVTQLGRIVLHAVEREGHVTKLVELAHYDQLTGLANRRTLHDRYIHARALSKSRGMKLGFLSIDLDRFKTINDTLGHEAGDVLLQEVARRLRQCVREHDTVARLGGDEFAVLLTELERETDIATVAERLLEAMRAPIDVLGRQVVVTVSVGALSPDEGSTLDDLLRSADQSMYQAKRSGRNQLVRAQFVRSRHGQDRLALEHELADAVRDERFSLVYQPQYRVGDGSLVGFEALMRWARLDGTAVSPGVFIPLLEEMGLIAELGPWLLRTACGELRRFRDASSQPVRMAVNLSGRQLEHDGIVDHVERVLRANELEPRSLELEITENVLMRDLDQTARVLDALSELGARVAIDDFGTGYSSLSYLQRFRVATLKVDRCFVSSIDESRSACIAEAVIHLGHRLGMEVVAEGVETPAQLAHLRAEGCDIVQGFLLARPAPSTEAFQVASQLAS
ncbi:MAG: EAL domain-containing protein [Sandaracinaceae bacterium]